MSLMKAGVIAGGRSGGLRITARPLLFRCASAVSASLSHSEATFNHTALSSGPVIFTAMPAASWARFRQSAASSDMPDNARESRTPGGQIRTAPKFLDGGYLSVGG